MTAIVAEGFLSRLSFGILSFALPLYAFQELGMGLAAVGVLISLNLVVALALKPAMGALADRIGLKRSFTASIGLRSVVSLLLVFAALPWQLFAIRTIHGVSISLRDPSVFVLIADHGGKKAVASAFAWYQTAKSVAGALGKGAGGILLGLTASDFSLVFLIAFVLSALPIVVVARYVREPGREGQPAGSAATTSAAAAPAAEGSAGDGSSRPAVLPFMGFGFLVSSTAYMLANLFPIFAVEYAGLTAGQAGAVYMIAASLTLTGPFFGWLSDNVSRRLVLSVRSAANVASSVIYLAAPSFAGLTAGRALDDLGKAAFRPAWGAMMAEVANLDKRRRARTMGAMSSGEDAGEIFGPILAGLLWSVWGVPVLLGVRIALAVVTELYSIALTGSLRKREARASGVPRRAGYGYHRTEGEYGGDMATQKQRQTAKRNVKKAQAGARRKKTITKLSSKTRSALGREGAKAAARKRGASKGTGSGAGAMTVPELRREAAKLGIEGRSKMGKAQLVRAVGQKRKSRSS